MTVNYTSVKNGNTWAVFNLETKKKHSVWPSQRAASQAAADLNRYLRNFDLNAKLKTLSISVIKK